MAGKSKSTSRSSSGSSGGKRGRSAITGRYVRQPTVRSNPRTTVNESTRKR